MKLLQFLKKNKQPGHEGVFAKFFLHASEKEMKDVITEAARRANEDQRSLVDQINRLEHKTT